jgi:hypothetical protein
MAKQGPIEGRLLFLKRELVDLAPLMPTADQTLGRLFTPAAVLLWALCALAALLAVGRGPRPPKPHRSHLAGQASTREPDPSCPSKLHLSCCSP